MDSVLGSWWQEASALQPQNPWKLLEQKIASLIESPTEHAEIHSITRAPSADSPSSSELLFKIFVHVLQGQAAEVSELLQAESEPLRMALVEPFGFSPLHVACVRGDEACMAELLKYSTADVDQQDCNSRPCSLVAALNLFKLVRQALRATAGAAAKRQKRGSSLPHIVPCVEECCKFERILNMLKDKGANLTARFSKPALPVRKEFTTSAHWSKKDFVQSDPVSTLDVLSEVLNMAFDTWNGCIDDLEAELMIRQHWGLPAIEPKEEDIFCRTRLHYAALAGDVSACKLLLDLGCNLVSQDNSGMSALHAACSKAHGAVVELLLDYATQQPGGSVLASLRDKNGRSALHVWQFSKSLSGVQGILRLCEQSSAGWVDSLGLTPAHVAVATGSAEEVAVVCANLPDFKYMLREDLQSWFQVSYRSHEHFNLYMEKCRTRRNQNQSTTTAQTVLEYALKGHNPHSTVPELIKVCGLDALRNAEYSSWVDAVFACKEELPAGVTKAAWGACKRADRWPSVLSRSLIDTVKSDSMINSILGTKTLLEMCVAQGRHELLDVMMSYGTEVVPKALAAAVLGHLLCLNLLLKWNTPADSHVAAVLDKPKADVAESASGLLEKKSHVITTKLKIPLRTKKNQTITKVQMDQCDEYEMWLRQGSLEHHQEYLEAGKVLKKSWNAAALDRKEGEGLIKCSVSCLGIAVLKGDTAAVHALIRAGAQQTDACIFPSTLRQEPAHLSALQLLLLTKTCSPAGKVVVTWKELHTRKAKKDSPDDIGVLLVAEAKQDQDIVPEGFSNKDIVTLCISQGYTRTAVAIISCKILSDDTKSAAAHWACFYGNEEVLTALIEQKTNLCVKDSVERTALEVSLARGHLGCAGLICTAVWSRDLVWYGMGAKQLTSSILLSMHMRGARASQSKPADIAKLVKKNQPRALTVFSDSVMIRPSQYQAVQGKIQLLLFRGKPELELPAILEDCFAEGSVPWNLARAGALVMSKHTARLSVLVATQLVLGKEESNIYDDICKQTILAACMADAPELLAKVLKDGSPIDSLVLIPAKKDKDTTLGDFATLAEDCLLEWGAQASYQLLKGLAHVSKNNVSLEQTSPNQNKSFLKKGAGKLHKKKNTGPDTEPQSRLEISPLCAALAFGE